MTIVLDGSSLTIEKLVAIARDNEKVELAPEALERIKVCRAMLEEKLANKEIMYGTNTGIGEFSEKVLNDDQVKEFQRYLFTTTPPVSANPRRLNISVRRWQDESTSMRTAIQDADRRSHKRW